ncbi:hypothetical protein KCU76_g20077, partial [Aureobasidium melanogenum]
GKKIAVYGFSYKKNTADTRESAAISVVKDLIAEQAKVCIYDPQVTKAQIWEELDINGCHIDDVEKYVSIAKNPYDCASESHAVIVLTEWDEFSNKDVVPAKKTGTENAQQLLPSPVASEHSSDNEMEMTPADRSARERYNPKTALKHAEAQNAKVDWEQIFDIMERPAFVFDGRRVIDAGKLQRLGFRVECIGRGNSFQ